MIYDYVFTSCTILGITFKLLGITLGITFCVI